MKTLTISDVRRLKDTDPLYVLNSTNTALAMRRNKDPETGKYKQERADVIINVHSQYGDDVESIVVPQSFLPVDITEYVSIADIRNCRPFFRAIREGLLTVIDEDSANELFNTPGAVEERARLQQAALRVREANSNRFIDKTEVINVSNPSDNSERHMLKSEVIPVEPVEPTEEDAFDTSFVANVIRWTGMSDIQVQNEMRVAGKFSRKELKYVMSKLDPINHKNTLAHIKSVLSKKKKVSDAN